VKAVRLLSGGAAHGLVEQVRAPFQAKTGCTIDGEFGAVGAMKARQLSGWL
jgi:molybdate transport system substrate-binding protein